MSGPGEVGAVRAADGQEIDQQVDKCIREIQRLLQKKRDDINDEKSKILIELNQEREKLQVDKKKVVARIEEKREELSKAQGEVQQLKLELFESNRPDTAIVNLNVGGERISSMQGTLTACPGSTLSAMFSSQEFPGAKDADGACFIDRNPRYFRKILEFLRAENVPDFDTQHERDAFRKEVEYFGLTDFIFPPTYTPPDIQKTEDRMGKVMWMVRCDVSEIKRDSVYATPDFLQEGNRWRVMFRERSSFLSVYVHNVDAGLKLASWEGLPTKITLSLKNSDEGKAVVQTIEHTFTRRAPNIGLNYVVLMDGLRSSKGGFLQHAKGEGKPALVFQVEIQRVYSGWDRMGSFG
eukprot:TRINITY_DN16267_c0_g1_i3.p1 TRINITY_DN16267_c0_g1~~TRINITY_DN16267_c0_g1_i3.p1  ORF type:complete len:352 (+),score=145.14 TRINITY_DN16267_c0_g1_i3:89-1144(+)